MRAEHSHLSAARWRKSSYSDGGDSNCVEVADGRPGVVPVRDSTRARGPVLHFGTAAWRSFLDTLDGRTG
ncbi:protein of unknown function [Streptomyces zhaozhouensis]|uniref:DUF397 domain-containing protein n=1 Tax=Streptomyces zhaozhouensis TaxID=1300267 RepID=A0A286E1W2_9ACTN|nr:DUF397 domain-containing protein [Streptomyces zhaozhouensis]SOD64881.1 protein of unknown function [Streptomyces zhaozhouensis]